MKKNDLKNILKWRNRGKIMDRKQITLIMDDLTKAHEHFRKEKDPYVKYYEYYKFIINNKFRLKTIRFNFHRVLRELKKAYLDGYLHKVLYDDWSREITEFINIYG